MRKNRLGRSTKALKGVWMVSTARKAEPDIRVDHTPGHATGNPILADAEIPSMPPRVFTTMPTREIVVWTPMLLLEMAISHVLRAFTLPRRRSDAAAPKLHADPAE